MRVNSVIGILVLLLIFLGTMASAANFADTTMTWFVSSTKSLTVSYGSPCSSTAFFFPESKAEYDADSDGNWARTVPHSNRAGDTNCQTSAQAGMTVNNTGTAVINVDGNFSTGFTGADVNIVLKVWQGSGSGCGTNGMGGWEMDCSVVSVTSAPNTTTCRNFNQFNETAGARLATNLGTFASQQLCFSGDGNGFLSSGDHNGTFTIGGEFS
jgi:hypothetical protein